ncbi:MAG: SDR family oxidoreductase [Acidimicrobiales bacterium]
MDIGINGRRAILLASSRGLGRACAESLAREGVHVVINGRDADTVESTTAAISSDYGVEVTGIVGDAALTETHDRLLAACPEPDILLLNGDGPPPTPFTSIDRDMWREAADRTMVAPLDLLSRVIEGMQERRFGRVVAITSAMVKSPNPLMAMSSAPRLGLTGVLKGLSKTTAKHNVTLNTLLPERFDTDRQEYMAQVVMKTRGLSYEAARREQVDSIRAARLGLPNEFGDTFAFLCSAQASYLTGQNIQLDGGSYDGVF